MAALDNPDEFSAKNLAAIAKQARDNAVRPFIAWVKYVVLQAAAKGMRSVDVELGAYKVDSKTSLLIGPHELAEHLKIFTQPPCNMRLTHYEVYRPESNDEATGEFVLEWDEDDDVDTESSKQEKEKKACVN